MIRRSIHFHHDWLGGSIGTLLAVALGVGLYWTRLGDVMARWSFDLVAGLRAPVTPQEAVIIFQDEESERQLNQKYNEWDRSLYARLLDQLMVDGPRLIVFDVVFLERGMDPAADRKFAEAIRRSGRVLLGIHVEEKLDAGMPTLKFLTPIEPFALAAAGLATVSIEVEPDYGVRRPDQRHRRYSSLAWEAARKAGAKSTRDPSLEWTPRWLNYYGPAETIPSFSYWRVLETNGVPAHFFRNKVVFIGARPGPGYRGERKDEFRTPYTWSSQRFSSGVEIHATDFLNVVRKDWLIRWPPQLELTVLLLAGFGLGYGLSCFRPLVAGGVAVIAIIGVTALAFSLSWNSHIWFAWLFIVAMQIPAALTWGTLFQTIKLHIEKRVLQESLALHLAPARVRELLRNPETHRPGGEQRTISVLFSDISNFVGVTERMHPDDLVRLLNKYFEASLGCIHDEDGTVIKLIGDSIFAIWNAPLEQAAHQKRACRAALRMHNQLVNFDAIQRSVPLRTRIGLHTGLACVGNVGSSTRVDYTAIGQSVNLASRLESFNKHLGTSLLATRDIQIAVENEMVSRPVGLFKFQGSDRIVEVYELIGALSVATETKGWRASFAEGLFQFQRGNFDAATPYFERTLHQKPHDGPSQYYMDQIAKRHSQPPPPGWSGEIELTEK